MQWTGATSIPTRYGSSSCWFDDARDAGIEAPESMALATSTPDGRPSVRMVLLKRADEHGFDFHTNYESRKGAELAANPAAALLFHWQPLGRQVRVEGRVQRVPAEESEAYFLTRPHGSRLAAWASPQSRPLADRDELERLYAEAAARFPGDPVPLPPHWGGLRLQPATLRVLAARRQPAARPDPLRALRRCLEAGAARAVGRRGVTS